MTAGAYGRGRVHGARCSQWGVGEARDTTLSEGRFACRLSFLKVQQGLAEQAVRDDLRQNQKWCAAQQHNYVLP